MKKIFYTLLLILISVSTFAQVPDPCTGAAASAPISTSSPCNCSETNIVGGTPCNKSMFGTKALSDASIHTFLTAQNNWALPTTPVAWQDVRAQALSLGGAFKHEFCTEVTTSATTNFLYIINIAQVQINCTAVCQDYKFIKKADVCGINAVTPVLVASALDPTIKYRRYAVLPNTTYIICRQLYFDGNDLDCYTTWTGGDGINSLAAQVTAQHWFYFESNTSVLPIKLDDFTATNFKGENYLNWKAETETNLNRYEVEKSEDGNLFNKIGEVLASTSNVKQYNFVDDKKSIVAKVFYRLKIIELDGKIAYSKIIVVSDKTEKNIFTISPNPASDKAEVKIFSEKNANSKMFILSTNGNIISTKNIVLQKGSNFISLDVTNFPKGVYFVKLNNSGIDITQKLIVQ